MSNKDTNINRDRSYRTLVIVALIIAVLCLSVCYATFSSLLSVNSTLYFGNNSWMIRFENVSDAKMIGSARELSQVITNYTNIKIDVELSKPGDEIIYTFDVKNCGDIDAVLSTMPIVTGIPDDLRKVLIYKLTYDDGTEIGAGDTLSSGQARKIKLTIMYDDNSILNTGANFNNEANVNIIFVYLQK